MSRIRERNERVVKDEDSGLEIRYNRHPKKRNNIIVAAMYQMYLHGGENGKGCSLDQVGRAYRKTRQAVYDLFRSRGYPLRSKQLRGLTVIDGIRFTATAKGGRLRGTLPDGRRLLLSHYLWEKHTGNPVPAEHVIVFKDGDQLNTEYSNLELVPYSKMQARFNPTGKNQFSPGGNGHTKGYRAAQRRESRFSTDLS